MRKTAFRESGIENPVFPDQTTVKSCLATNGLADLRLSEDKESLGGKKGWFVGSQEC